MWEASWNLIFRWITIHLSRTYIITLICLCAPDFIYTYIHTILENSTLFKYVLYIVYIWLIITITAHHNAMRVEKKPSVNLNFIWTIIYILRAWKQTASVSLALQASICWTSAMYRKRIYEVEFRMAYVSIYSIFK